MSKPVYSFAYIQVKDHADYLERYGKPLPPIIEKFGGEFLAATQIAGVVEGEAEGNWAVLAKFPSQEQAQAFYTSPEYAPYLKLRREELTDGSLMVSFAAEVPKLG
ncbi:DUF1330 domain-containing protein [Parvularcula sp. ZS-1/3]|uniref:DUF1330 domain-containing protein n=1 Tax=Parvularcula mediterranea TaxID=2732508 RepID=A0A7Y3RLQ1_9PROT|nr:DUF1330 domain-containing protein [Parvularcula mediterranea]NNU16397.1 DUF1330 domain-containing protein [Parvularcula mediterranea]